MFSAQQPMVGSMDLLWLCRRFLSRAPSASGESARARADQGDADAQFGLGLKCVTGEGAPPDFAQGAHWLLKAAEQNHRQAQFHLGMMLTKGQGMPRDDAAAFVWIRKAAEGGDSGAQQMLGMRCHRSSMAPLARDASESRIEAFKWFHLSAVQGHKGSEAACERVTLGMTSEEVAEGNQRAATFVARNGGNQRHQ
ncbi:MAG TPA: tetratricopeptide repeat protein [Verrucomicrobiae bacterium]|nr:tetratricopeptide repeat protein [Verrucomicrobiae bacterium]